ncbi:MAG TPA: PA14 domain-containing protein [Verrucomicrobiales bacterium]|nr:PA14 domain-containing protein [Verrucomicrobiales bacterium]
MKTCAPALWLAAIVPVFSFLCFARPVYAQAAPLWEAYNDYRPSDQTHPNATTYDLRVTDDGGPLKNFATGLDLNVSVRVVVEGSTPDDFGANSPVNPGSPADLLFGGIVDVGNDGLPGLRTSGGTKLSLVFEGLDPSKRYHFRGTVSRGGNYNDRWSVFTITGTEAHVAAHIDGSNNQNLIVKATYPAAPLAENQVAMNTGDNKAGSLVGWDNIEPGNDRAFTVEAQQYQGAAPFGNPAAAPYGYGFNSIYLAEVESTGELRITENPPVLQVLPAGSPATFRVEASSPQAVSYQWQRAEPGSSVYLDIDGATGAVYTTEPLTSNDHGAAFRCLLRSGGFEIFSAVSMVEVDAEIPSVARVEGSINFNAVYLTFSEPMKLALLADPDNYSIDGGLTIVGVVVRDALTVRLLTSLQPKGADYAVSVSNLEDLAGNPVDPGVAAPFRTFSYATETVGLEIWETLGGAAVQDLRNSPRFPGQPDVDYAPSAIDSTLVFADGPNNTYGGRFRAWLIPEESGEYHFFLRADDAGEFGISEGVSFEELDDPARPPDAAATGNIPFQEPGVDQSTSEAILLEAGKQYAVQVLWKESNGPDRAQLAWRMDGDPAPADQLEPIPGRFFVYFGANRADSDGDGMSDGYELLHGLDVGRNDADEDLDGDGLSNKDEYDRGTAASLEDTDGDGLKDGVETGTGLWVSAEDTGTDPLSVDSDGDTLWDGSEVQGGTDPNKADTDGDGFADNIELALNTDPVDGSSQPTSIVAVANGPWDAPQTWSDNRAPRASESYVAVGGVTSVIDTVQGTFGGRSLTLAGPGVALQSGHVGAANANLTLRNASVDQDVSNTLGGSLNLQGNVAIEVDDTDLVLSAAWRGAPLLNVTGGTADANTGSLELTGGGSDFGGLITVSGTSLRARAPGSLGTRSLTLAGASIVFGYEYESPEAILIIRGDGFGLTFDADVTMADLVGTDTSGVFIFSLYELAGGGPYTVDDLLALFQLDSGISGTGTLTLLGNTGDIDLDGLPDDWEMAHFGGLDAGPGEDPDADGRINLAELAGATDPNEWDPPETPIDPVPPGDEPVIGAITKDPAGVSLSFPPGAEFDVEYSEDLDTWSVIATGVSGEFQDPDPVRNARASGYYRGVTR